MSNPAVTKLANDTIGKLHFWMDDNIGESIHIHLEDMRLDLTIEELDKLSGELTDAVNKLVSVDGFDCHKIDPVYLSLMLSKRIKHLQAVKLDTVRLSELYVNHKVRFYFIKFQKLTESRAVKALRGDTKENSGSRKSHHIGQTSEERLEAMKNSISTHGYPYDGQYIILYGDQMLIRDGQHRAACLYVEKGDIEIPVLRLYFDNLAETTDSPYYIKQLIDHIRSVRLRHIKKWIRAAVRWARQTRTGLKNKLYFFFHKRALQKMQHAYFD